MKVLFLGGTGTISSAITRLAVELGWELFHLNRGGRKAEFAADRITHIDCDIRTEEASSVRAKLKTALGTAVCFDVVADFIGFVPDHVEKDFAIFNGLCRQFIFISSASAYQKPLSSYLITESTPLANPFWQYSRDKIACEEFLMRKYRECGFPITIVRPSPHYDSASQPHIRRKKRSARRAWQ